MANVNNTKRKDKAKVIPRPNVQAYVQATFNNTIVSIAAEGAVIAWATAGGMGFKGSRKATPYAAQQAASKAAQMAIDTYGARSVEIFIKGAGPGREAAARALSNCFEKVTSISDVTGIPHNGVRAQKERRV